jgi:short-subunit dehydrogenase
MRLAQAAVLVTGATGGIGSAIARRLHERGASLLLAGRDRSRLDALERELDFRVATVAADLATAQGRERVVERVGGLAGGLDILVNVAGINRFGWLERQTAADVEQIMLTNAVAPILLCQALIPSMRRQQDARIVNVGSILGSIGLPGNAVYSASKFALRGFSEALRRELADTAIRVHYVAPRATRTAFNDATVRAVNDELGVASDAPEVVAEAVEDVLFHGRSEKYLGWPEKLFVRLNSILPRLVDRALARQLPVVERHVDAPCVLPIKRGET